jgi:hypothetical protein
VGGSQLVPQRQLREASTRLVGADVSLGSSGCHNEGVSQRRQVGCGASNEAPILGDGGVELRRRRVRVVAAAESPTITVAVSGCNI